MRWFFALSQEQFAAFEGHERDRWCQTAAKDLFEAYETYYTAFAASSETLLPMVQATASWAQRHDIRSQADVFRLCHVAASLGHRFWQDPRFQGYVTASVAPEIPAGRRGTAMMGATKTWLRGLWANDTLQDFSQRLAELVARDRGAASHNLQYVLPGHWQMFTAVDNDRLINWLGQSAPELIRDGGAGPACLRCLCPCSWPAVAE